MSGRNTLVETHRAELCWHEGHKTSPLGLPQHALPPELCRRLLLAILCALACCLAAATCLSLCRLLISVHVCCIPLPCVRLVPVTPAVPCGPRPLALALAWWRLLAGLGRLQAGRHTCTATNQMQPMRPVNLKGT